MPINSEFWNYFDQIASPKLAVREKTFRKIFNHLDKLDGPIIIVETGCVRLENNWTDGQSTIMFDKYINFRDQDSQLFAVDINLNNVTECKRLTSNRTQVHCDDSVHYLNDLSIQLQENKQFISFLYLDSFDLDEHYWFQSAAHHLKELASVMRCINKKTLVVVDDCPLNANFVPTTDNQLALIGSASIGGKARLIAEYASEVGAKLEFVEYQAGWTGF